MKTLTGEQHALAVTRQAQRATLLGDARPARDAATAHSVAVKADPGSRSWEIAQAERDADTAVAAEAAAAAALEATEASLAAWAEEATVARVAVAAKDLVAIDALDKRIYWVDRGTLWRTRYGPGGAHVGTAEPLLEPGVARALYLHRPTARLYWTAHGAHGWAVRRAYLDGEVDEEVPHLNGLSPHARVLCATIGGNGTLSVVYVAVATPGNASLVALVERKNSSADAAPAEVSVRTILKKVAPTALAVAGGYLYFTLAVNQQIRRCELDGTRCALLHSFADAEDLPWAPRQPPPPADGAAPPADAAAVALAERHALHPPRALGRRRRRRRSRRRSRPRVGRRRRAARAPFGPQRLGRELLWWAPYEPVGVDLDGIGAPPSAAAAAPRILALEPRGGGGGRHRPLNRPPPRRDARLRYAPEGRLPPADHGTKMAVLPICHADCPQTADAVRGSAAVAPRPDVDPAGVGYNLRPARRSRWRATRRSTMRRGIASWRRRATRNRARSSARRRRRVRAAPMLRAGWRAAPGGGRPPAEGGVLRVRLVRLLLAEDGAHVRVLVRCTRTSCRRRPTRAASRTARRATRRPRRRRRRRRRRSTRGSAAGGGGRRHVRADAQLEPRPPVPHAMPGAAAHSGAHVDTVTESTMVVRTPSLPAQRAQLQVAPPSTRCLWGYGGTATSRTPSAATLRTSWVELGSAAAHGGAVQPGRGARAARATWGETERVYMAALYTYYETRRRQDLAGVGPRGGRHERVGRRPPL